MENVTFNNVTWLINGTSDNVSSGGNHGSDIRSKAMSYLIYKIGKIYQFT